MLVASDSVAAALRGSRRQPPCRPQTSAERRTAAACPSRGSCLSASAQAQPTACSSSRWKTKTEIANLIVWPSLFERQRRLVLSASMIGCRGKVQREGQVIHVIAEHLTDLSALLGAVGEREEVFPLPYGRGDEAKHGSGPDPRNALGSKQRDIYIPDLRIEGGIAVKTRDFR